MKKTTIALLTTAVLLTSSISVQAAKLSTLSSDESIKSVQKLTLTTVEAVMRFSYLMGKNDALTVDELKTLIGMLIDGGYIYGKKDLDIEGYIESSLNNANRTFKLKGR